MLTTRPHLTTLRPSPTTVSFTVSTASRRQTLASQFVHHFLLGLRILFGLTTLAVLLAKSFGNFQYLPLFLSHHIEKAPWSHIGPLSFASFYFVFRRFHTGKTFHKRVIFFHLICKTFYVLTDMFASTEESLLTLRSLGIQTSTLSKSYLLPSNTRFIPTSQIRDIFIHEAFRGFEVRYYLAVVVEGEGEVVVVFPVSM